MAKPETVTWADVCTKVNFGDGLYSTCKQKVPGFQFYPDLAEPPPPPASEDFDESISRSALPVPPPPPPGWQPPHAPMGIEAEGGLTEFLQGEMPTKLLWGALGALLVILVMSGKKKPQETAPKSA
jgi:hypothetical protein